MSENFKELLRYTLNEWYKCDDVIYSKILRKIANSLMDVAHENGFQIEVSHILDEFS